MKHSEKITKFKQNHYKRRDMNISYILVFNKQIENASKVTKKGKKLLLLLLPSDEGKY